jgi:hypothetical protein
MEEAKNLSQGETTVSKQKYEELKQKYEALRSKAAKNGSH